MALFRARCERYGIRLTVPFKHNWVAVNVITSIPSWYGCNLEPQTTTLRLSTEKDFQGLFGPW